MLAIDVLILVLLELTLLHYISCNRTSKPSSSFNPCFIGTYSITYRWKCSTYYSYEVLILVLLELTLLQFYRRDNCERGICVLILVLLELTLLQKEHEKKEIKSEKVLILVLLELTLLLYC